VSTKKFCRKDSNSTPVEFDMLIYICTCVCVRARARVYTHLHTHTNTHTHSHTYMAYAYAKFPCVRATSFCESALGGMAQVARRCVCVCVCVHIYIVRYIHRQIDTEIDRNRHIDIRSGPRNVGPHESNQHNTDTALVSVSMF